MAQEESAKRHKRDAAKENDLAQSSARLVAHNAESAIIMYKNATAPDHAAMTPAELETREENRQAAAKSLRFYQAEAANGAHDTVKSAQRAAVSAIAAAHFALSNPTHYETCEEAAAALDKAASAYTAATRAILSLRRAYSETLT